MKGAYIYGRHSQWKVNCNVDICEEGAISFEGIPEVANFSDDIFGRGAYIIEGFFGVGNFTVGNEQKTATTSRTQEWKV